MQNPIVFPSDLNRMSSRIISPQAAQAPIVLDGLDQRVVRVLRRIGVVLDLALDRIANQRCVHVVRRAVGFALVVRHHHGEILGELDVLEQRQPHLLQVGGDVRSVGVVAVVVEVRHVVPPLRERAGIEIIYEVGAGHDVGAPLRVAGHQLRVDCRDVLGGVRVRDAVGGFGVAAAGVVLGVHFPADAALLEEVEHGGVAEAVDGGAGVIGDAEGGAGDGGDVVGQGRVGDAVVLAQETVVLVVLDLLEGWVGFGGAEVGVFEHEETPLLEVFSSASGLVRLGFLTLLLTAVISNRRGQDRADEREEGEGAHYDY